MVDNDNWTNWKEEYFTTAVKAATYIKNNKLKTFTIWMIGNDLHYHIIMSKNNNTTVIYNGYAIPKVLTDLVRWKEDE